MPAYRYEALDADGKAAKGLVEAESTKAVSSSGTAVRSLTMVAAQKTIANSMRTTVAISDQPVQ